jgi:predicted DNA-binding transcriptional regulator AlpA
MENVLDSVLQKFKKELTDELHERLLNSFRDEIFGQLSFENKESDELLTRKQVANLYKVSLVTLRSWEKESIIPKPIRKGSRVYWPKSVIMNDIKNK